MNQWTHLFDGKLPRLDAPIAMTDPSAIKIRWICESCSRAVETAGVSSQWNDVTMEWDAFGKCRIHGSVSVRMADWKNLFEDAPAEPAGMGRYRCRECGRWVKAESVTNEPHRTETEHRFYGDCAEHGRGEVHWSVPGE